MFNISDKKKRILTISAIIYAVLVLVFILIANFEKFSMFFQWVNDKLSVFSPIIVGAIIAYLATPLVRLFQNKILKRVKSNNAKRFLSILFTYITILIFIIVFVLLIIPQLISSGREFIYKMTDGTYLNSAIDAINRLVGRFSGSQDVEFIDLDRITASVSRLFTDSATLLQKIGNWALSFGQKFFVSIKNILLGLLISVYFVIFKERLSAQSKKILLALFNKKHYDSILTWSSYADQTFGGFIVGKLIDALTVIVLCSIGFSIAGIPYALLLGTIIGISNIIPFFGPFIGAIPSGFIVLIANPGKFILFVILLLVIQQIDANVIEPNIVSEKTGLSSLGVICAVLIMSGFFGIIGMFFGVPLYAVICTIIKSFVDKSLSKKEYSTELSDYYPETSLVDPNEEKVSIGKRFVGWLVSIFKAIGRFLGKVFRLFSQKRKEKKQGKQEKQQIPEETDTDNQ